MTVQSISIHGSKDQDQPLDSREILNEIDVLDICFRGVITLMRPIGGDYSGDDMSDVGILLRYLEERRESLTNQLQFSIRTGGRSDV